jgi:hypothetical protein
MSDVYVGSPGPAAVLRRLRPRLPHVLPGASAGHAARGLLVVRALSQAVPPQVSW